MKYLAAATLVLSMAVSGAAFAQDAARQQEALEHNDAYNAAMQAGDYDAALNEAVAAWQAAEAGWGDDPNTAALAMQATLAYLDMGRAPEGAQAAARTLALASQAQGAYTEADAQLWAGMTTFGTDPAGAQANLRAGLAAMDAANAISEDTVRSRLILAALQIASDRDAALAAAEKVAADAHAIDSPAMASHLLEVGKLQYLGANFAAANATLLEAIGTFPEQPVGTLDPVLASALAWQRIAGTAILRTATPGEGRGGFGPGGFGPPAWMPERQCNIDYEARPPTMFPAIEGRQAQLGAAVVMWDLDANGAATNVRILASAPGAVQHEQLIMQEFTGKKARFAREACRQGWVEVVGYDF